MSQNINPAEKVSMDPAQSVDIPTRQMPVHELLWGSSKETQDSITALYLHAETHASDAIAWYRKHKRNKATMSRSLRFVAILFATVGGLAPILSSVAVHRGLGGEGAAFITAQLGYLALGLAAASVGLDKFFGFSSGWMRYITTMMTLDQALSLFRFEWAMTRAKLAEKSPTSDQVQLLLQHLKEFVLKVNTEVEQETKTWVSEFRMNLAEIEKSVKAQTEAAKPGVIDITVTNGMAADDGFMVSLDGMELKQVRGTKCQLNSVSPGMHKIGVTAKVKGKQCDANEVVNVDAGLVAQVTLALPLEEAQP